MMATIHHNIENGFTLTAERLTAIFRQLLSQSNYMMANERIQVLIVRQQNSVAANLKEFIQLTNMNHQILLNGMIRIIQTITAQGDTLSEFFRRLGDYTADTTTDFELIKHKHYRNLKQKTQPVYKISFIQLQHK
jgi:hypothetical protein